MDELEWLYEKIKALETKISIIEAEILLDKSSRETITKVDLNTTGTFNNMFSNNSNLINAYR